MKLLKEQCINRGYYYEFVGDIITNESFECDFPLEVGGSLEVGEWLEVGESLEVGGSLKVGGWLKVGESLEVGEWLKVGEWLEVGESLEVGEWLEVGESLEGRIIVSGHCKWKVSVSKTHIHIGCEKATIEEWDARFAENWHKDTNPNTPEYAMIKAAYQVARAYFLHTMPLIGAK